MTVNHVKSSYKEVDIFDKDGALATAANKAAKTYGNIETRCGIDPEKMWAYETYLRRYAKDKVVCDIGTGPGILAYLALRAGAKKVYCIEAIFTETAKTNLKEFSDRVVFIEGDAGLIDYPQDIDIIIHEVLGCMLYDENILRILKAVAKSNKLHTVAPKYWEMFTYTVSNDILQKYYGQQSEKITYEYKEEDFLPYTIDFHKLYNNNFPDVIKMHSNLACAHKDVQINNVKIFHTWSIYDPITEWNKIASQAIKAYKNKEVFIGWRAYMDPDLYFGNYPRWANNWGGVIHENHFTVRRLYNQMREVGPIANPFSEKTCQYLS